jgi:hypothetical protein
VARGGLVTACVALAAGALALAVMLWAFRADPARAFHSYLTAYVFVLSVLLGALGFTLIAHAANTTWPVALRRLSEASVAVLPLFALLFVPIVLGLSQLYPWARTAPVPEPLASVLAHRRAFMNPRFFTLRAYAFLALWSVVALRLRGSSLAMDKGADGAERSLALRRSSSGWLVAVALTVAFAGFDWLMSLSPEFASTMFGAYFIATCLFGGCAWLVLLVAFADRRGFSGPLDESHYHALGRLLLTFLIFVGYLAFFQYMLCWIGNKPDEVAFYLARARGTYGWESLFLVLGHLFVPFFALLSFRLKRRPRELAAVGLWCLASQYVHVHWLVTAESARRGFVWLDLVALVAVGGLALGAAILLQRGKSTVAARDPRYAAALAYRSR